MKPQPDTTQSDASTVKDRVFTAIDGGQIAPRSKYVFLCQQWMVWGLWAGSIIIGALSVAVLLFVSTHRYYDIYEATHENFFTFILEALPFVWFAVFAGMLVLAIWQLRNTKRGYRLSATFLGVTSFLFSVVLGGLFHIGGFGWSLDRWLGQVAPMYDSQAKMEQKMWQNPADGRLIGRQVSEHADPVAFVLFLDASGDEWNMHVADMSEADRTYLAKGHKVRVLGQVISTTTAEFHACGVFPWMLDAPAPVTNLSHERELFVDRMYTYYEDAEARRIAIEEVVSEQVQSVATSSPCYQLEAVRRVHEGMYP